MRAPGPLRSRVRFQYGDVNPDPIRLVDRDQVGASLESSLLEAVDDDLSDAPSGAEFFG